MGRSIACFLLMLVAWQAPLASATAQGQIRVASESWEDYTQSDGQGLVWDILRLVYSPAGIDLVIHSVPHTRAAGLARRGEVDAFAGSYRYEVRQGIFYPEYFYDVDVVSALSLKDAPTAVLDSLENFRTAWLQGYQFQRYLPISKNYREVSRGSNILSMLDMHHTDYYLDDVSELEHVLAAAEDPALYKVTQLIKLPVYLGFSESPRGQALAALFDERMKVLVADGSLRPVFQRWKQIYPFD